MYCFVKKGPRIIADVLVQNYTNEIDTLLEIVAFSSSHILLRRQYIEIIIQPLMLYVLPNNIEKHRILALTALKHCAMQIEQPCTAFLVQGAHTQDIWEIIDTTSGSTSPIFCCRVCTFSCWKYGTKQYRGQLSMICECCKKPNTCLHIPNKGAETAFNYNVLNAVTQTFHRPENSVAILIAVCDLIAALAKETFTDVSPGNSRQSIKGSTF